MSSLLKQGTLLIWIHLLDIFKYDIIHTIVHLIWLIFAAFDFHSWSCFISESVTQVVLSRPTWRPVFGWFLGCFCRCKSSSCTSWCQQKRLLLTAKGISHSAFLNLLRKFRIWMVRTSTSWISLKHQSSDPHPVLQPTRTTIYANCPLTHVRYFCSLIFNDPGFCRNGQCEGLPDEETTMSKGCLEDSKGLFNVSHAQDRWLRASFAQVGSTIYVQTYATWHETASSYNASSVNRNRWDLYMYEQWAHNCGRLHQSSLSTAILCKLAGRTNAQLNHRFTAVLLTVKQWLKESKEATEISTIFQFIIINL